MNSFLHAIITPTAVVMLAIWVFFLFSLVWGGAIGVYKGAQGETRSYSGVVPFLFYLLVFVVAFIAWCSLVFAG